MKTYRCQVETITLDSPFVCPCCGVQLDPDESSELVNFSGVGIEVCYECMLIAEDFLYGHGEDEYRAAEYFKEHWDGLYWWLGDRMEDIIYKWENVIEE